MLARHNGDFASAKGNDQLVRVAESIFRMFREHPLDHGEQRAILFLVEGRMREWRLNVLHQRTERITGIEGWVTR